MSETQVETGAPVSDYIHFVSYFCCDVFCRCRGQRVVTAYDVVCMAIGGLTELDAIVLIR
jgi:hypothetical protein